MWWSAIGDFEKALNDVTSSCLAECWCCNKSHRCIQGEWCRSQWREALAIEPAPPSILNPGHTALQQHSPEPETLPMKVQQDQRVRRAQPPEPLYFNRRIKEIPLKAFPGTQGFSRASPSLWLPLATGHQHSNREQYGVFCALLFTAEEMLLWWFQLHENWM